MNRLPFPFRGPILHALLGLVLVVALVPAAPANEAAWSYFGDATLIDQHGREQRFYSDLLHGKVVLIHPFFTHCEGICPVMAANLAEIQKRLGARLGRDVHLLSISVDPERDTVAALQEYAARFEVRDGWYLLTGEPSQLNRALARLGYSVDDPEQHTSVMAIGNVPSGLWKKAHGAASARELIEILESVINDIGP